MKRRSARIGADTTAYAASLGYRGARAVVVRDGLVVSHRMMDWFEFCEALRRRARAA